jgi:hypothetical protein
LNYWKYEESSIFLQGARDGTIEEVEDDAITLRQLLHQRDEKYIKGRN